MIKRLYKLCIVAGYAVVKEIYQAKQRQNYPHVTRQLLSCGPASPYPCDNGYIKGFMLHTYQRFYKAVQTILGFNSYTSEKVFNISAPLQITTISRLYLHNPLRSFYYHSNKVSKPLMGQLVADHDGHPHLSGHRRLGRVYQQECLPIRHQSPVLHSTYRREDNGNTKLHSIHMTTAYLTYG